MTDTLISPSFEITLDSHYIYKEVNDLTFSIVKPSNKKEAKLNFLIKDKSVGRINFSIVSEKASINNALAIPRYPGSIDFIWECNDKRVSYFEIWASNNNITYEVIEFNITNNFITLNNLNNNIDMYFKLRGVYPDGYTEFVQFKTGKEIESKVDVKFTTIIGSVILEDSIIPFRYKDITLLLYNKNRIEFI